MAPLILLPLLACALTATASPVPEPRQWRGHGLRERDLASGNFAEPPPMCQPSGIIQNIDTCDAGNGIFVVDEPPPFIAPVPVDGDTKKFVSLMDLVNKGNRITASLPECQPGQVIQNTNACRQVWPATWDYSLTVPDPSSPDSAADSLTTTFSFDASIACPYSRVQNYRNMKGEETNATLIEMWDDINSVDDATYEKNTDAELFELLQKNKDLMQEVYKGDIYDYMGLTGTSLDLSSLKLSKRADDSGGADAAGGVVAAITTTPNILKSAKKRGDFRVFIFGFLPTFGLAVSFTRVFTKPTPTAVEAIVANGPVMIALTGGMIAFNVRDRWRRPLADLTRAERWVRSAWIVSLKYLFSVSAPATRWLYKKYPELAQGLPSLTHRDEALEALPRMSAASFSTTVATGGSDIESGLSLLVPQQNTAPMTLVQPDQMMSMINKWSADFKAQCVYNYALATGGTAGRLPGDHGD